MFKVKAIIIHGWDGSPEEKMHSYLKSILEEKGFQVRIPQMPDPERPKIDSWIQKISEISQDIDEDTYFVGHSLGCQAVLRFLETLPSEKKIAGAVLIAPWMYLDENTIKEEGPESVEIVKPWVETPIDWNKVKSHTDKFLCILSDNDPYVPLSNQELFESNLGAEIIILQNKGHFTDKDNITEMPEVLSFL